MADSILNRQEKISVAFDGIQKALCDGWTLKGHAAGIYAIPPGKSEGGYSSETLGLDENEMLDAYIRLGSWIGGHQE